MVSRPLGKNSFAVCRLVFFFRERRHPSRPFWRSGLYERDIFSLESWKVFAFSERETIVKTKTTGNKSFGFYGDVSWSRRRRRQRAEGDGRRRPLLITHRIIIHHRVSPVKERKTKTQKSSLPLSLSLSRERDTRTRTNKNESKVAYLFPPGHASKIHLLLWYMSSSFSSVKDRTTTTTTPPPRGTQRREEKRSEANVFSKKIKDFV